MDKRATSLVVVGASAGGVEAVSVFAAGLPGDLDAAVCVVLHLREGTESHLARIVSRVSPLHAVQVHDTMPLKPSCIYVARPGHHLAIDGTTVRADRSPQENGFRPSINVLFRSAAAAFGARTIGVILSGTRDDGVDGASAIGAAGGCVIVQDPADATFPGLPAITISRDGPDEILLLAEIAPRVASIAGHRHVGVFSENAKGDDA
jgi:two-component system chemotaxis response regulator CheB